MFIYSLFIFVFFIMLLQIDAAYPFTLLSLQPSLQCSLLPHLANENVVIDLLSLYVVYRYDHP